MPPTTSAAGASPRSGSCPTPSWYTRSKPSTTSSDGTYGSPRVHKELLDRGVTCGRRRVRRLMRMHGLEGRCKKRWRKTTIADPAAEAALDLIQRHFGPSKVLDARYVGDITYIATWEGWAYLATVIDLASRRVVGWAMADHMRAELTCDALSIAIANRRPGPGSPSTRIGASVQLRTISPSSSKQITSLRASPGRKPSAGTTPSPRAGCRHHKERARRPLPLAHQRRRSPSHLRVHRGLVNTRRLHSSARLHEPRPLRGPHPPNYPTGMRHNRLSGPVRQSAPTPAPMGYTLRGKDLIGYENPFDVGMTGLLGYGACYEALHKADLVLRLGTDFPYDDFLPTTNNIQVDIDPARLGRRAPVAQGVAADIGETLRVLFPHVPQRAGPEILRRNA